MEKDQKHIVIMSKNLPLGFEVTSNKVEEFLAASMRSNAFKRAMARAQKHVPNFEKSVSQRQSDGHYG